VTIPTRRLISIDDHPLAIQITDDGSRTLIDPTSGVAYHSASGAASETKHVYLRNSGISDRVTNQMSTSILEIGFGTGMAMLMTVDLAVAHRTPLQYTAIEHELLGADLLGRLELDRQLDHPELVEQFLTWRKELGRVAPIGELVWQAADDQQVTVHHQNASKWTNETEACESFDAIFFDPFAPDTDPELWQASFLRKMHRMLKPDRTLVTYCVNRAVREAMESAGFQVRRVPGPIGGKREVLVATKV
jgi:tRNA U34 5-methylaminomethyl-2-thiouridine-forming methyltransferase MnmC